MKKIFTLFAALAMVLSMSAAKLYLTPNANWKSDNARFAAYFFDNGEKWLSMTKVSGETDLYEVEAPAGYPSVIFCRMNPNAAANNWNNKWNQTGNLVIPTDGKNHFTVPSESWDGATTTWSTYTYTPPTLYIAGDFVTPNWNPAAAANKMDYADGVYSKSYNDVAASAHQFKITKGGWDGAIGYNQNTCSGTNCTVENGNDGNIKFTPLAEGTITITYTVADGKVHITCPEPPAAEYNITYPATQTNYTLTAGPAKAQAGAEVSFTATPAEGYVLNVTYNGNAITSNNNVYAFLMPAADVTIAITAVTATTLYYVDNSNWGNANAYMWSDHGNNGWPGVVMTSVGTVGDNAYSYYSISFAQGAYTSIIFNNGSGSQTGDLTINTAKPYFYDGAWYTWDELLAKLAAPVVTYDYYITGSFNNNNPKNADNGMTLDGEVYKATVTLAAGDHTLKVTDGTWDKTWGYDKLGASYEEVSNPNDYNNIKITLTAETAITVIFDANATAGNITFEGLTQIHTVKVTAENGTVKGLADDGKYEHGAEATLTAEAAEGYEFTCWTSGEDTVSTENPYSFEVTSDVALVANFEKAEPEIEYIEMALNITNTVFDAETMAFSGSNADYAIELSLIPDMEKPIEGEEMTFGLAAASTITREGNPMEIIEGQIAVVDVETASANAIVAVKYGEEYYRFNITMTKAAAETIEIELTGPAITVAHEDNILSFTSTWTYNEVEYPFNVKLNGVETLETKNYEDPQVAELKIGGDGDDDPWLDWAVANEADVTLEGETITLEAHFTSFATGTTYHVTISGDLPTISYELNGGELVVEVPTQEELWASFKTATGLDTKALSELSSPVQNTIAGLLKNINKWYEGFDVLEWKWLKSYIQTIQANQAGQQFVDANGKTRTVVELKDDISSDENWRFAVAAFFAQSQYVGYPAASADFTEAGKPEAWGAAYQAAHAVVLPTEPVDAPYTLPTPVKTGYTFVGWYDNAEGTGDAYSVIPAGWSGTLYAIWEVEGPATALENIAVEGKVVKTIINGQLIIVKDGVQYNAQGAVIK